jgi:hypothetical protein
MCEKQLTVPQHDRVDLMAGCDFVDGSLFTKNLDDD